MFKLSQPQINTINTVLRTVRAHYDRTDITHKVENYDDEVILLTVEVEPVNFKKIYTISRKGYLSQPNVK